MAKPMTVTTRLERIRADITTACREHGRDPQDVQLVAVSKTRPPEAILEASHAGHVHFGENYAQELRDKSQTLAERAAIKWHYIGRIQRNKAKYIAPNAYRIHTLENEPQAKALLKRAPNGIDALLAVNIGREEQKSGLLPEEMLDMAKALAQLPGCRLHGLMCLPPIADEPEDNAPYFEEMVHWMNQGRAAGFHWQELSMGMSADFAVAIRYGATWVRVGTAIFGPRS